MNKLALARRQLCACSSLYNLLLALPTLSFTSDARIAPFGHLLTMQFVIGQSKNLKTVVSKLDKSLLSDG